MNQKFNYIEQRESMLSNMDIVLVSILRQNLLYPQNVAEFMECVKKLDEDPAAINAILSYSKEISPSIYEIYTKRKVDDIKTIIKIITQGGSN